MRSFVILLLLIVLSTVARSQELGMTPDEVRQSVKEQVLPGNEFSVTLEHDVRILHYSEVKILDITANLQVVFDTTTSRCIAFMYGAYTMPSKQQFDSKIKELTKLHGKPTVNPTTKDNPIYQWVLPKKQITLSSIAKDEHGYFVYMVREKP